MSNKNPFEIRSEMLAMAKEYLDLQYHMNVEFTQKMFEQGKKTAEEMQSALTMYTTQELMDKAKELYSFVATKSE